MGSTVHKKKNPLPPEDERIDKSGVPGGPALGPMKDRESAYMRRDDEGPVPLKSDKDE